MSRARTTTVLALAVALVAATQLGGCIIVDDDGDSTLTIVNRSSYTLFEVHLADVGQVDWGPNLLPHDLRPNEELVITDIQCGTYDVLVHDETRVDCVLENLDLCFDDEEWVITNSILDRCASSP